MTPAVQDEDSNAVVRKLGHFATLSREDALAIERVADAYLRRAGAHEDLIREGDRPDHVNMILAGWACRYKTLEDGRRQILAFLLPGDLCDVDCFLLERMDHSVSSVSPVTYATVPQEVYERLVRDHPGVALAIVKDTLSTLATQREWTLNLGQRDAFERVAHLFCELFVRLRAVGLTRDRSCGFPATQADLADASGMSAVHVNRTVQALRSANLIVLTGRSLTVPNLQVLQEAALFNPNYLHLREPRA